jgi:adenylylsulfate kinase
MTNGFTVWFTGLPSSGKSTIADALATELKKTRKNVERLDGDKTRALFWPELGFSKADRDENIRRVSALAALLTRGDIAVITSFISPYKEERKMAREQIGRFLEVYVRCPIPVCMQRDVKGMYQKAIKGEIKEFTGVSDPYEEPDSPDIILDSDKESLETCVQKVINLLDSKGYL